MNQCRSRIGIVAAQLIQRRDVLESVPSSLVAGKVGFLEIHRYDFLDTLLVLRSVSCDINIDTEARSCQFIRCPCPYQS